MSWRSKFRRFQHVSSIKSKIRKREFRENIQREGKAVGGQNQKILTKVQKRYRKKCMTSVKRSEIKYDRN